MVTCSDSLLRVPLSLQLLPIVLFHQQESDLRQACISSRLLLDGMVSEPYQAQLQQLGQMLSALLAGTLLVRPSRGVIRCVVATPKP